MNNLSLWQRLKSADLVTGEVPDQQAQPVSSLWYVRVLQGVAGWLTAVFMLGFLGFGISGLFEQGSVLLVLGIIINISTYIFFKTNHDSDFFEQLVLVFSLTGQFLFAFGLFQVFKFDDHRWLIILGLYQLLLMWVINHYLHRLLCAWFAVIALFWGFDVLVYSGIGSALVAGLFVWIWLDKAGWQADKNFYEPIGYALAFSLLQLNIQNQVWLGMYWHQNTQFSWLMQNSAWISAVLNSLVLLYFVYRMVQERRITLSSTAGRMIVLAAVAMLFSALPVIGLSSALLVLLVGYARQNKLLLLMGVLALVGFVSWYYYSLQSTLLIKSMILIAIGVVLLLGALLLKYVFNHKQEDGIDDLSHVDKFGLSIWQKLAAVLTLVMCLVGVNHAIWQKEQVLQTGQSVFLELAPVDPRSIMQGDFMRLRFAMAQQIHAHAPVSSLPNRQESHDGYVWVKADAQGVGKFHALYDDSLNTQIDARESAEPLLKLQYRIRKGRVQFATNAFFFQEGDAQLFDAARFGQFKVAEDGELLLAAMYDKDLVILGQNRMD